MLSDEWLPRYRLLENFTAKWNGNGNGNGNAYDRGDYNSSFALRAVELKITEKWKIIKGMQMGDNLSHIMRKSFCIVENRHRLDSTCTIPLIAKSKVSSL